MTGEFNGHSILVIDDSRTETAFLRVQLENAGYAASTAADGQAGLRALDESRPDLVLLDVVMPGIDGWKTLELIREVSDVPVIMLTARDSEIERVRGLRGGADDYIGKPFGRTELIARIEAVLRRSAREATARGYSDGVVEIDFASPRVRVRDAEVALTPLEFRLLSAFTESAGEVLSWAQLRDVVLGSAGDAAGEQIELHVSTLSRKIDADPAEPELIETVPGAGYRYRRPA
jgi:DNA-binding response OmpR family regulator